MKIERPWLTGLGMVLIIFGAILLSVNGLPLILDPIPHKVQTENVIHPINLNKLTSINWIAEKNPEIGSIKLNFDTVTIFAGDSVWVRATASDVNPNVNAIFVIVTTPEKNYKNYTGIDVMNEVRLDHEFNQTIALSPLSNPPYQTREELAFLQADQPVTFHGFVFLNNGSFVHLDNHETPLTVLPITDKLQAETNLSILKQINETKIANIKQDTYNNIVLGLTWLGVGAIPILVGTDILLRIYVSE